MFAHLCPAEEELMSPPRDATLNERVCGRPRLRGDMLACPDPDGVQTLGIRRKEAIMDIRRREFTVGVAVGLFLLAAALGAGGLGVSLRAGDGGTALAAVGVGMPGAMVNVTEKDEARAAIQAAIDAVQEKGGGTVFLPAGTYVLDGEIVISSDGVRLVGESRATVLKAGKEAETLIHFAASHGGVENLTLHGRGDLAGMIGGHAAKSTEHPGVTAIRVSPRRPFPKDRRVHVNYNRFCNLVIAGCATGIVLQAAPNVPARGDSGCWYNVFDTILVIYTTRGIWFRDPANDRGSSPNRNQFYSVRVGQSVNTAVQIDAGDTNSFIGCSFEGVGLVTWPSKTPTAILIKHNSSAGADNNCNTFVCARFEGNAVDVENHNGYTEFYASNFNYGKKFSGSNPMYVVGGYDPSYTPQITPGIVHAEGLPGLGNGITFVRPTTFQKGFTSETEAQE